jgi:hypothetical protein
MEFSILIRLKDRMMKSKMETPFDNSIREHLSVYNQYQIFFKELFMQQVINSSNSSIKHAFLELAFYR